MICKICGQKENTENYIAQDILEERQLCFTCNFWLELLEEDKQLDSHRFCVVNGTHYRLEDPADNPTFAGFGGNKFHIRFNDGFETTCTNLWCQGDVPERFRKQFPDNAEFVYDKL